MANNSIMHDIESQTIKTTTTTKNIKTSIHVTALDGIVNVNALFTVAIFIGFSVTDPAASATGQHQSCHATTEMVRRLIVWEVVSFSWFLFSSLIAQSLKLVINLLNNLEPNDPHKADIKPEIFKFGTLVSAFGSLMGCVFLMLSIIEFVQVKLGLLSCGGKQVWAVVVLGFCVGSALVVYLFASIYALCVTKEKKNFLGRKNFFFVK